MSKSTLGRAVQDYLGLRRSFGYVLAGQDRPLSGRTAIAARVRVSQRAES